MPKRTVALAVAPTVRTVLRAAKLLVSALLAAATLMVVADRAGAQEMDPSIADTDGYVPIYTVCFGSDSSEPYVPGAAYIPFQNGDTVEGIILFDVCVAEDLGLGPNDIQLALEHELGHARGLLHSDDPNDIMYPVLPITGT
ncbi:MAG: matrixin family metalloprotease [Actinomycetota bacterium]|nr:matrixin family metalloprotease [Actinomycetota bacterium]